MTFEEANFELALLAEEVNQEQIDIQYEEMENELYALWELEQYERDCYNMDAEYYGGRVWQ